MQQPYRNLLFDADDTLLDFKRAERIALSKTLRAHGVTASRAHCMRYSEINDGMWKRLEAGALSRRELKFLRFQVFFDEIGIHADPHEISSAYMENLSHCEYRMQGALSVCRKLSRKYRLYIVTNGTSFVQHGRLDHSPLMRYISGMFISDDIGYEKPSKAFFDAVLSQIPDATRESCLLIGDSLTSDMFGGYQSGIDTCWMNAKAKQNDKNVPIKYQISSLYDLLQIL